MTTLRAELRARALESATAALGEGQPPTQYLGYANIFYAWIAEPATVKLRTTVQVFRKNKLTASYETEGGTFMTALTIDDTVTISIKPEDDHGDETADTITWEFSDNGSVFTQAVAADTHSVTLTPIAEGTGVTVTATDPSSPNLAAFTASFDVGPGATSQLVGNVTVNTGANTVPPPAA